MFIICNGAQKSGSTWLYNILKELKEFSPPPEQYLTENSRKSGRNPCIRPDRLESFLSTEDFERRDYLSKNHLARPEYRDLVLARDHVRVFGIERDTRDVVVSAYFDVRNRNGYEGDFKKFYWSQGRVVADTILRYHNTWRNCDHRVCVTSYEKLQTDFTIELRRIAATMGVDLEDNRVDEIKTATSMGKLRERYQGDDLYDGDNFFRKGTVGDWKNHFSSSMERDIERIRDHGLSTYDPYVLKHRLIARIRRAISR